MTIKSPVLNSIGVLVSIEFLDLPLAGYRNGIIVGTAIEPAVIFLIKSKFYYKYLKIFKEKQKQKPNNYNCIYITL